MRQHIPPCAITRKQEASTWRTDQSTSLETDQVREVTDDLLRRVRNFLRHRMCQNWEAWNSITRVGESSMCMEACIHGIPSGCVSTAASGWQG